MSRAEPEPAAVGSGRAGARVPPSGARWAEGVGEVGGEGSTIRAAVGGGGGRLRRVRRGGVSQPLPSSPPPFTAAGVVARSAAAAGTGACRPPGEGCEGGGGSRGAAAAVAGRGGGGDDQAGAGRWRPASAEYRAAAGSAASQPCFRYFSRPSPEACAQRRRAVSRYSASAPRFPRVPVFP